MVTFSKINRIPCHRNWIKQRCSFYTRSACDVLNHGFIILQDSWTWYNLLRFEKITAIGSRDFKAACQAPATFFSVQISELWVMRAWGLVTRQDRSRAGHGLRNFTTWGLALLQQIKPDCEHVGGKSGFRPSVLWRVLTTSVLLLHPCHLSKWTAYQIISAVTRRGLGTLASPTRTYCTWLGHSDGKGNA